MKITDFSVPLKPVIRGTVSTGALLTTVGAISCAELAKQLAGTLLRLPAETFKVLTEMSKDDKVPLPNSPWTKVYTKSIDFVVPENQTQLHTNSPEWFGKEHFAENKRFFNRVEVKTSKAMVYVSIAKIGEKKLNLTPPGYCKLAVRAYNPHPTNMITIQIPRYGFANQGESTPGGSWSLECDAWKSFWNDGGRKEIHIDPKQSCFLFIEELNEQYVEMMASLAISGDDLPEGSATKCVIAVYVTKDETKIPRDCIPCNTGAAQYSGATNRFYFKPKEPLSVKVSE